MHSKAKGKNAAAPAPGSHNANTTFKKKVKKANFLHHTLTHPTSPTPYFPSSDYSPDSSPYHYSPSSPSDPRD